MAVRRRHRFAKLLLMLLVVGSGFAALWLGLVPQRLSPFAPLRLDDPPYWLVDFRLAALRRNPDHCRAMLRKPHIEAARVDDEPISKGCGWVNAFRISEVGVSILPVDKLSCEMAAGLALWMEGEVQPLARELLGSAVKDIRHMGSYSCRNIVGNVFWKDVRSQHATANALDISAFTLADGRRITVQGSWKSEGPEGRFLREVHRRGCRYFRVALSPDFNAAHHDHFHFDRGPFWRCR